MPSFDMVDWILALLIPLVSLGAAGHALLHKRDPRSALGWVAVSLFFPLIGAFLYFLFGFNRIRTRARKLNPPFYSFGTAEGERVQNLGSWRILGEGTPHQFREIAHISDHVTRHPLVEGNSIEMLNNGEQAYPAMLKAIAGARRSVCLSTYIFETNESGQKFIEALADARKRGLDVRVMVDGVGELYSSPRATELIRKTGVRCARFIPPKLIPPSLHVNLRNHRKILTIDGKIGFTGGMNIGDRHLAENLENPSRVVDAHFRIEGPVVAHMEEIFLEDWFYATGEDSKPSPPSRSDSGRAVCRAIVDGPNEDLDKLSMIFMGAVASARWRVTIMTPYFLPPRGLVSALQTAALRGVDVRVILPAKNNLPYVQWAANNMLWELLRWRVRVYFQPPPFVHSKLFLVDDAYVQVGSANVDTRSLRLNFEMIVEVFDRPFAQIIASHMDRVCEVSREVRLRDVVGRSLPVRVRDAACWLFSPYL